VALALAATEGRRESDDWTGFERSNAPRKPAPRCLVGEITTINGDLLYGYGGATTTANEWVPAATHALALETVKWGGRKDYRLVDLIWRDAHNVVLCEIKLGGFNVALHENLDAVATLPESALVAKEVRDLTGLSAERLGDIFPVERESYQRWISGKTTPSSANLERLLALRHFARALAARVADSKTWLLSPLPSAGSGTAYDTLRGGNLNALWDAIGDLPSSAPRYTRQAADGTVLTVTEGSLRGRDFRTSAEGLDDDADWLSEDE
jgi:transcriptional regulator with XRE-family HTH domain